MRLSVALSAILLLALAGDPPPARGEASPLGEPGVTSVAASTEPSQELNVLSEKLLAQAAAAGELDRAASLLDAEERQTRDEYQRIQQQMAELDRRIALNGRTYVRMARHGLLPMSGGLETFLGRASRLERLRHSLRRDLTRQRELARRTGELSGRLESLRNQRGPMSAQELASLRNRSTVVEAQERALAFERAFANVPFSEHTAVYGAMVPFGGQADPEAGFVAMRGRLPFPVAGRAEILRARRRGGEGPGLELRVMAGAAVQAVYPGRVVFADRYADYGKTVIVDHGQGYFTVSAGLDRLNVTVGQDLESGASVGTVGDSGSGPAMYFEVRHEGDPVDPAPWFGI